MFGKNHQMFLLATRSYTLVYLSMILWSEPLWAQGGDEVAIDGFTVDRFSRNAVVKFWQTYFQASEGFEERYGTDVDLSSNVIPTPSARFNRDVARRVNFYRALAGLPADIDFSDRPVRIDPGDAFVPNASLTRRRACMEASFVMSKNSFISHDLPPSLESFTDGAWNGARYSNLTIGFYGPRAVDNYMGEPGTVSDPLFGKDVGHRRWILYTRSKEMATGDIPPILSNGGTTLTPASNALYSITDFKENQPPQFVAWPNDGFFPSLAISVFWSLSYQGAIFENATVTMTGPSGNIPVTIRSTHLDSEVENPPIDPSTGNPKVRTFGDSTIVFEPTGLVEDSSQDVQYTITVSGIEGNGPSSHTYDVTIINPDQLLETIVLTGSSNPPLDGASYSFDPVPEVDHYEFEISSPEPVTWVEGGEDETSAFVGVNPPLPDVGTERSDRRAFTGSKSLWLSFPRFTTQENEFAFQSVFLQRFVIPQEGAQVHFRAFRDIFFQDTTASLEVTNDGGVNWFPIWETSGTVTRAGGLLDPDNEFQPYMVSLDDYIGQRINFRFVIRKSPDLPDQTNVFRYDFDPGGGRRTGIFFDEISVTNSVGSEERTIVTLPATALKGTLDEQAIGEELVAGQIYDLRARAILGGRRFGWGPVLRAIPEASGLSGWQAYLTFEEPGISDFSADDDDDGLPNGLEYAFGLSALDVMDASLEQELSVSTDSIRLTSPIPEGLPDDLSLRMESSDDLIDWKACPNPVNIMNGVAIGELERTSDLGRYFRWMVELK